MFQVYQPLLKEWRSVTHGELAVLLDKESEVKHLVGEQGMSGLVAWINELEHEILSGDGCFDTSKGIVKVRVI